MSLFRSKLWGQAIADDNLLLHFALRARTEYAENTRRRLRTECWVLPHFRHKIYTQQFIGRTASAPAHTRIEVKYVIRMLSREYIPKIYWQMQVYMWTNFYISNQWILTKIARLLTNLTTSIKKVQIWIRNEFTWIRIE